MRIFVILALLLAPVLAQIGGYFSLGGVPDTIYEGEAFTVAVKLEMSAKEDVTLNVSSDDILTVEPSKLVIAKGTKTASFRVQAGLFPVDVRVATRPISGRLSVSSGKQKEARDIMVLPRGYRRP